MSKTIYLTIDDAPSSDCINKLNYLQKNDIQAVWFTEGERIQEYPDYALEIIRRGHIIGNHSMTHPHFSEISLETACVEIAETDDIINRLYEKAGIPREHRFFRFPYGDKGDRLYGDVESSPSTEGLSRRATIQTFLRELGYTQPAFEDIRYEYYRAFGLLEDVDWYWTYDTHDWCPYSEHPNNGITTAQKAVERMDENLPDAWRGLNDPRSAEIVLIHDHITPDNIFMILVDKLISKHVIFKLP